MEDAAAPAPWGTLLALVKRLGPYDRVVLDWDAGGPVPDGWQSLEIPGPGGRQAGRLRLHGGPPLPEGWATAIRQLAAQLHRSEQAHAFLQVLGRHVVHDLRTPVTIIQGYGDLLRTGKLSLESGMQPLQAIVEQTARLLAILQDFAMASGSQVPGRHVCPGTELAAALPEGCDATLPPDLPLTAVEAKLLKDIAARLVSLARLMAGPAAILRVAAGADGGGLTLSVRSNLAVPLLDVGQEALAGIPPSGPHARVPWLMRLIALQRLVDSQGGALSLSGDETSAGWHCHLPAVASCDVAPGAA